MEHARGDEIAPPIPDHTMLDPRVKNKRANALLLLLQKSKSVKVKY